MSTVVDRPSESVSPLGFPPGASFTAKRRQHAITVIQRLYESIQGLDKAFDHVLLKLQDFHSHDLAPPTQSLDIFPDVKALLEDSSVRFRARIAHTTAVSLSQELDRLVARSNVLLDVVTEAVKQHQELKQERDKLQQAVDQVAHVDNDDDSGADVDDIDDSWLDETFLPRAVARIRVRSDGPHYSPLTEALKHIALAPVLETAELTLRGMGIDERLCQELFTQAEFLDTMGCGGVSPRDLVEVWLRHAMSDFRPRACILDGVKRVGEIESHNGISGSKFTARTVLSGATRADTPKEINDILSSRVDPAPRPSGGDSHMRFFHGTWMSAAESIAREGVDATRLGSACDFGTAFYTTVDYHFAMRCALLWSGSDDPGILVYDVPVSELPSILEVSGGEWERLVASNRRNTIQNDMRTDEDNGVFQKFARAKVVSGPVCANPEMVESVQRRTPQPVDGVSQHAFLVLKFLEKYLVGLYRVIDY